jgi:inhibitor of KinA sporulation pathway (predicted exonuclease)
MNKDNFVILDIETNTTENLQIDRHFHAIQIGATKITNGDFKNYQTFNAFIKTQKIEEYPEVGTELTAFIKKLTKITQEQVDTAEAFPEVWNKFLVFSAPYFEFFASWGKYDWDVLKRNCDYYDLPFPFKYHVNLKDYYKVIFKNEDVQIGAGVRAACNYFKIPFNEQGQHNGLEDAKMITAIADAMVERGFYTFKKTSYNIDTEELLRPTPKDLSAYKYFLNPILVKEWNKTQKRLKEIKYFMFP